MKAWQMALGLGAVGAGVGAAAASGVGLTSQQPIWALEGGVLFALLGAVLGGVTEIVAAIKETGRR